MFRALIVATTLVAAQGGSPLAPAFITGTAAAATGEYGTPQWMPLRGETSIGCTYHRVECGGAHQSWAIDIPMERNRPIYASGRGQVIIAEDGQGGNCDPDIYPTVFDCPDGKKGNVVLVNHGSGGYSLYGHLETVTVNDGEWVDEHTIIGGTGSSGWTQPWFTHLHYEEWAAGPLFDQSGNWDPPPPVEPYHWKACRGGRTVTYPEVLGYSSWASVPYGDPLANDGTCMPNPPSCVTGFADVPHDHPFCTEIEWMVANQYTTGYSDGLFHPDWTSSRQVAVTWLYRYAGSPPGPFPDPGFSDVGRGHPFYQEIAWAVWAGVAEGFADGEFKPTRHVSRQSFVAWLYRLAGSPPGPFPDPGLSDVPPGHLFYTEISWGVASGIVTGYADGTFKGGDEVSRGASSAFLFRYGSLN